MSALRSIFKRLRAGNKGAGLRLRREAQKPIDVPLDGGASIRVRPATSFEISVAAERASRLLAGLMLASDVHEQAAAILGEEFRRADFDDPIWRGEVSKRLALLELCVVCVDSWTGVRDPENVEAETPTRELLALLLQDIEHKTRIEAAISVRFHEAIAEGNGSPALPNGGAGIPDGAQTAGPAATPAPGASASNGQTATAGVPAIAAATG